MNSDDTETVVHQTESDMSQHQQNPEIELSDARLREVEEQLKQDEANKSSSSRTDTISKATFLPI